MFHKNLLLLVKKVLCTIFLVLLFAHATAKGLQGKKELENIEKTSISFIIPKSWINTFNNDKYNFVEYKASYIRPPPKLTFNNALTKTQRQGLFIRILLYQASINDSIKTQ